MDLLFYSLGSITLSIFLILDDLLLNLSHLHPSAFYSIFWGGVAVLFSLMYPLLLVVLIPFYHFLRTSCLAWLCWVNPLPMSLGTSFASSRLHRAVAHIFGDWVCSFQMTLIFAFSPAFGHLDGFTIFLLLLIHLFVLVLTMHSSKGVIHFWYLGHWRLRCWYAFQAKKLYVFTFFLYHLHEANIFKCTMRNHLLEIVVARAKITTDRKHWHVTEQAFWVWTEFFFF
jgi:hypothetical protein